MEVLLLTVLLAPLVPGSNGVQTRLVQTIRVHPGDDVLLTGPDCSGMTSARLQKRGSDKYADHCRDGHPKRPQDEDPQFEGRVEGLECPMKDGNVSTTLKNVTREDAGTYDWFCQNGVRKSSSTVVLEVSGGGAADGNATSGKNTSGKNTSGNTTTSGNATSGNPPDVRAIIGGIVGVGLGIVMIVILYLYRNTIRRVLRDVGFCQQVFDSRSDRPVSYREVNQHQV